VVVLLPQGDHRPRGCPVTVLSSNKATLDCAVEHSAILYITIQCNTLQYNTV